MGRPAAAFAAWSEGKRRLREAAGQDYGADAAAAEAARLRGFYERAYVPANAVLIVVGAIDVASVEAAMMDFIQRRSFFMGLVLLVRCLAVIPTLDISFAALCGKDLSHLARFSETSR